MLTLTVALLTLAQAPAAPPAAPPAPAQAPAPARRAAPASVTIEVRITDRRGGAVEGGKVVAEGPSSRDAVSDRAGSVTFRTMATGTYRVRAEADGYVTLEKEVVLRAGTQAPLEFSLNAAPAAPKVEPPPPPPAPTPAAAPRVEPGESRTVSLIDMAENSLNGREPLRTVPIGCSGLSRAQLLVVRENQPAATRDDADDMLYVIAGEGSITIAGKTQPITSGWFSVVPRGSSRALVRRGKNPLILLSVVGGPACASQTANQ